LICWDCRRNAEVLGRLPNMFGVPESPAREDRGERLDPSAADEFSELGFRAAEEQSGLAG
jgi:hypothetical protein